MLLKTKLYIPATRGRLVPRPALLERLNAGLSGRLTLVSAPAGFGKTTLIAHWGQHLAATGEWQFTWLSLDENDNDPAGFCTYLVAALQQIDPDLGGSALEMLLAPPAGFLPILLTDLINALSARETGVVLALDDYHLMTNPAIHEGITFLLEKAPPHFHLVLVSRADPPFPLGRLRARNQVTEIRQNDLRFTTAEAAAFLQELMALDLPESAVAALEKQTEGWVAGLQMAALSLQGRPDPGRFIADFTGSHRYIFDYLAEEALAHRPAGTREFLLQTAVLYRFCAPLCNALREQDDAQAVLEQLESANLFLVPLDDTREWYRYHPLFADLLRHHLRREQPERIPLLHQRASRWFAAAGYADEALHHAFAAGDANRAAELVSRYSLDWVTEGEINKLLEWVNRLPPERQHEHPRLVLAHAWALFFRGSAADVEAALAQLPAEIAGAPPYHAYLLNLRAALAARLGNTGRAITLATAAETELAALPPDQTHLIIRGGNAVTLANAYYAQGDSTRAQEFYAAAMAFNKESGNLLALIDSIRNLGVVLLEQARLHHAETVFRTGLETEQAWALKTTGRPRKLLVAAPLHVSLGKLFYEWNRLDEAEAHLVDAVELLKLSGPANQSEGLAALARLHLARGEAEAVEPLLMKLATLRENTTNAFARRRAAAAFAATQCALYQHRPAADLRAALERLVDAAADVDPLETMNGARLLLALDRPAEVTTFLSPHLDRWAADGRRGLWLEGVILLALAHHAAGEEATALDRLAQAAPVAAPAGYTRLFLDAGPAMRGLLSLAVRRNIAPEMAAPILALFGPPAGAVTALSSPPPAWDALPDPLSLRETEVLQLIAQGLTNQEIAGQLFIATGTAKRHTANIYNKLAVNNRVEATARAYELGLVK